MPGTEVWFNYHSIIKIVSKIAVNMECKKQNGYSFVNECRSHILVEDFDFGVVDVTRINFYLKKLERN